MSALAIVAHEFDWSSFRCLRKKYRQEDGLTQGSAAAVAQANRYGNEVEHDRSLQEAGMRVIAGSLENVANIVELRWLDDLNT